jgi:hypothetical protein
MFMTSGTYLRAAVCFFGFALSGRTAGADRSLWTADEVVARHIAARGGVEAWQKIKSIRRTYEISGLTIEGLWAGDRARMDQFADDRTEVSATDGTSGWTQRSWDGPAGQTMTADAVKDVRERAALGFELFLVKELGLKVAVAGEEIYARAPVLRLSVDLPAGGRVSILLDAKTYLEVARLRVVNGSDGPEELAILVGDYRPEAGILMPHEIGPGYVRYKINEALDPTWFQKPK